MPLTLDRWNDQHVEAILWGEIAKQAKDRDCKKKEIHSVNIECSYMNHAVVFSNTTAMFRHTAKITR